jgi:penicillin-binding protein 1C
MVNNYPSNSSLYRKGNYFEPYYDKKLAPVRNNHFSKSDIFSASAAWLTFEALTNMDRPEEGLNWNLFESSKTIAWKTGTSYGYRDAWAVGITPDYVIVSWAGNADGEGRNGLTGASAAAPIMFDVYNALPSGRWFSPPYDDVVKLRVCKESGHIAGPYCNVVDTIDSTPASENSRQCPYHRQVLLDKEEQFLVTGNGYPVSDMVRKNWFVLPTLIEWYYRVKNPFYKKLPPLHPDCKQGLISNIDLIYPKPNTKIYIPYGFGQIRQKTIFEAAHRSPDVEIHWHIDDEFVGSTVHIHQIEIDASVGMHILTLVSGDGEMITRKFEVLSR